MSQTRKEQVHMILSHVRVELREMDIYMDKEKILPEPGEIKALIAQMEALLDVTQGVKKKPAPIFND